MHHRTGPLRSLVLLSVGAVASAVLWLASTPPASSTVAPPAGPGHDSSSRLEASGGVSR